MDAGDGMNRRMFSRVGRRWACAWQSPARLRARASRFGAWRSIARCLPRIRTKVASTLLSKGIAFLSLWVLVLTGTPPALARELTFEQRVDAQRAIERVSYSHLIGESRPFDGVVTRAVLEKKVRTYLDQSSALENFWSTPITAEALRSEMQRMARRSRAPDRLREIYASLGNDSFVVQECLVRPILVDRLSRSFFATDSRVHGQTRAKAERLRERLRNEAGHVIDTLQNPAVRTGIVADRGVHRDDMGRPPVSGVDSVVDVTDTATVLHDRGGSSIFRTGSPADVIDISFPEAHVDVIEVERAERNETAGRDLESSTPESGGGLPGSAWGQSVRRDDGARLVSSRPDEYAQFRARLSLHAGEVGPIEERREAFVVRMPLAEEEARVRVAIYTIEKISWERWWSKAESRFAGARVRVVAAPDVPLPAPARIHTDAASHPTRDDARSKPSDPMTPSDFRASKATTLTDDPWDPTLGASPPESIPDGPPGDSWVNGDLDDYFPHSRTEHTAVWTGSVMIVWGGLYELDSQVLFNTGGRYDPATDTWTATSTLGAPTGRCGHVAVWTGNVMIVWGGGDQWGPEPGLTGGRYDPLTDTWMPMSENGAPMMGTYSAVWTGSRMIVWLRYGEPYSLPSASYDPVADVWSSISAVGAPYNYYRQSVTWTGHEMIVWQYNDEIRKNEGARYDPDSDTWSPVSTIDAPRTQFHGAVWTGSALIVFGNALYSSDPGVGGIYDPLTDRWTPVSRENAPRGGSPVWTGQEMLLWGTSSGSRYDPKTDTWSTMSSVNSPTVWERTTVWDGSRMLIWGTGTPREQDAGGRYDPASDSWTPIASSTPVRQRTMQTAVWTGSEMILYGGLEDLYEYERFSYMGDGWRYEPATGSWRPVSTLGSPERRGRHTAVWTGREMIVWGGSPYEEGIGSYYPTLDTGGRYDPITDTWRATSKSGAPSPRADHIAVWTGRVMIVWGGNPRSDNDGHWYSWGNGGRYDPVNDTWAPTSKLNAPSGLSGYSAVWTGSEMVIWGGGSSTGGRYEPRTDTWSPVSTLGAPSPGYAYNAIWTGREVMVWGGYLYTNSPLSPGGRYDPVTDSWRPMSTLGVPPLASPYFMPTAVWTGRRMIVWTGRQGARYDPARNSWESISVAGAPLGVGGHSALWTGEAMLVWGGAGPEGLKVKTGGMYVDAADSGGPRPSSN